MYTKLDTQVCLSKEDDPSVFRDSITCTNHFRLSAESERDAKADLAARKAELEETMKIDAQQTVLADMEKELRTVWAKAERREALQQRKLQAQKLKL